MSSIILHKAAQQVLCETLGFDEGRIYYAILSKTEEPMELSYSKRYRLLKSLFIQGAVAKLKNYEKDFYIYVPLPPSFLHAKKLNPELITFLEELYIQNYYHLLETSFSQIILRDETGLVFFLLKYLMKDNANLSGTKVDPEQMKAGKFKIAIADNSREDKKFGVIDRRFAFEFSVVRQRDAYDCVGYIATKENYIEEVERNLNISQESNI